MKLTEQQLKQMFRESRNVENDTNDTNLYGSVAASERRLAEVERIADDSTLSASYQIMNQLHDWSTAIENDIKLSIKPRFFESMLGWLKPSLATAAIVTTVYFVAPEMNQPSLHNTPVQTDRIMFSATFEDNGDFINALSFDGKQEEQQQSDKISSIDFG